MPSFSIPIPSDGKRLLRPVVPVLVADASKIHPSKGNGQPPNVELTGQICQGLIDTGAEITCVSESLAEQLKLTPCGTRFLTSATHQAVEKNIYRLAIVVMVGGQLPVADKAEGKNVMLPMSNPTVIEASEFVGFGESGNVNVVIGMDIIQQSVMIIAGHDKRLTMSF